MSLMGAVRHDAARSFLFEGGAMNRRLVRSCLALVFVALAGLAQAAEWLPNTPYAVGALVTYQGPTYKCIQAHTSLPGWEPSPQTAALWQLQSGTPAPSTPTP